MNYREPGDYRQQQEQDEYQQWLNDPCEQKEYQKWLDNLEQQNNAQMRNNLKENHHG